MYLARGAIYIVRHLYALTVGHDSYHHKLKKWSILGMPPNGIMTERVVQ